MKSFPEKDMFVQKFNEVIITFSEYWLYWLLAYYRHPSVQYFLLSASSILTPNRWQMFGADSMSICGFTLGQPLHMIFNQTVLEKVTSMQNRI